MRKTIILCLAALALCAVPAASAVAKGVDTRHASKFREGVAKLRAQADRKLGREAGGRDILKYGIAGKRRARPATRAETARYASVLRRLLNPPPAPVSVAYVASGHAYGASSSSGYPSGSCGSGYRGLYQFDCQTWRSVGGSGDPAAASPEEQRRRAEILQGQRGNSPWPVCGRNGASLDQIAQCESGGDPGAVG